MTWRVASEQVGCVVYVPDQQICDMDANKLSLIVQEEPSEIRYTFRVRTDFGRGAKFYLLSLVFEHLHPVPYVEVRVSELGRVERALPNEIKVGTLLAQAIVMMLPLDLKLPHKPEIIRRCWMRVA